jgi:hypothetical protein
MNVVFEEKEFENRFLNWLEFEGAKQFVSSLGDDHHKVSKVDREGDTIFFVRGEVTFTLDSLEGKVEEELSIMRESPSLPDDKVSEEGSLDSETEDNDGSTEETVQN